MLAIRDVWEVLIVVILAQLAVIRIVRAQAPCHRDGNELPCIFRWNALAVVLLGWRGLSA
jgi:hypothetical protein